MPIEDYLSHIKLPQPESHKGQNGKVLLVGGSELFHAASKWSLDVVSRLVDMVFYASVPSNNELIQEAKGEFWNGIVIPRENVDDYASEADVILIGPGMTRSQETADITNQLLERYRDKKWVVDAGALQMMNTQLLHQQMIITPHRGEFEHLLGGVITDDDLEAAAMQFSHDHDQVCVLVKGPIDVVAQGSVAELIEAGNAGMTKGGTGDVLAGLVAGLYCHHDAMTAAVTASVVNKLAGDTLWKTVGPYYNASDLAAEVPPTLWRVINSVSASAAR